jgi:hypothetical protein
MRPQILLIGPQCGGDPAFLDDVPCRGTRFGDGFPHDQRPKERGPMAPQEAERVAPKKERPM